MKEQDKIVMYESEDGQTLIDVRVDRDTVWLAQSQLMELFGQTKQNISLHINNIFKEGELEKQATVKDYLTVQKEGGRQVHRKIAHYNLDVIISVGYRVKSKRGTQFRIWAGKVLKDYLLQGYALNQKKLEEKEQHLNELQKAVEVISRVAKRKALSSSEASGILELLHQYSHALQVLDEYDHQQLKIENITERPVEALTYEESVQQINTWRKYQQVSKLFGNEKDESFKSSLQTIYQTFDGHDLYPSLEEKAANLLYLVVKNHSFSDGNKRIAAGLFVYFLKKNKALLTKDGHKRIADNALVALTLMVAESRPEDKDIMVKVIVNLINKKN